MIRRSFNCVIPVIVATWVMAFAANTARAADFVSIGSPQANSKIPVAPGSVAVSGTFHGPAGTITVEIYEAQKNQAGNWVTVGNPVSSGVVTVGGSGAFNQPWSVTLNSPAEESGIDYIINATYKNTSGGLVGVSGNVHVTSD